MWIVVGIAALVVVLWRLRRRAKRSMVAGLDRAAFFTEPVPGRIRHPKGDLL